jgi:hypothetical protein
MNKSDRKFNPNDYLPKRFGLKYGPPEIILEYLTPSSGKLYHHKIKLGGKIKPESNIQEIMKEVYEKHYMYLDHKKVSVSQILKLVERLKNNVKNNSGFNNNNNNNNNQNVNNMNNTPSTKTNNQDNLENVKIDINELDDVDDEDYYKFYDYENEDLNKLNELELKKRKEEMEKLYKKNAVTPDDENFVFDVRVRK